MTGVLETLWALDAVTETVGDCVDSGLRDDERDAKALRVTDAEASAETEVDADGVTVKLFGDVGDTLTEPDTETVGFGEAESETDAAIVLVEVPAELLEGDVV